MIAKIKGIDGSVYTTYILAAKMKGLQSRLIAFDLEKKHIVCLKYWQPRYNKLYRKAYIVDAAKDNWIKAGEWEGFDWLLNAPNFEKFERVYWRNKNAVSVDEFAEAQQYATEIRLPKRRELKTQADIDSLDECALNFHDAIIKGKLDIDNVLTVNFDTTWGCRIILTCGNVKEVKLDRLDVILSTKITIEDGLRVFTVDNGISYNNYDSSPARSWCIKAEKMSWELIIN